MCYSYSSCDGPQLLQLRDSELYYLQSRYYDPKIGRFINADDTSNLNANCDFLSLNLFTYCGNNPVVRKDNEGTVWHLAIGAILGVATQYIADITISMASGNSLMESLKPTSSLVDYGSAAISGALAASGIGLGASIIANASLGGVTYLANCKATGTSANSFDFMLSTTIGGVSGAIGGSGANGTKLRGVVQTSKQILKTAVSPRRIAQYTAKITSVYATVKVSALRTLGAGMFGNVANLFKRMLTGSKA